MGAFRKVLFVINPNSGRKKVDGLETSITSFCQKSGLESEIHFTEGKGHATEIARQGIANNFDVVYAVGGDGTVNEVAKSLIHTEVIMGILPKGSGNGLSRHLGVSQKATRAIKLLTDGEVKRIDSLLVNGEVSVNVSGVGFDGHIANLFGSGGKRGLKEYVSLAATEFRKFKNFPAHGMIDGHSFQSDAFILAVANSSQFGNNATVSPSASVCDGIMDLCIIKKVPLLQGLGFAGKMFTKRMDKSAFVKIIKCKKASFTFENQMPYHIDGEGKSTEKTFSFEIIPSSINVLTASVKI
jgi:YegS/Rv2252/BmrU family lipid kinase